MDEGERKALILLMLRSNEAALSGFALASRLGMRFKRVLPVLKNLVADKRIVSFEREGTVFYGYVR